jgi:leader peptidase (prepilin peptidase)/N-methyltransferase
LVVKPALFALFGLLTGSFLNVCILRVPAHKSVITAPSRCPDCGRRLHPLELIPLFSYIAQRGRCRGCGGKISAQYPVIEAANALLWVLAALRFGSVPQLILSCAALSALLGLAVIDGRTGEIPFGFTAFIGVCGVLNISVKLWVNLYFITVISYIIGFFAVSLPLYIVYSVTKRRAVGGGDIKLLAASGLFLGWKLVILGFFAACLTGTVTHLTRMKFAGAGRELRLGPYLALGLAFAMFFGDALIDRYIILI